MSRVRERGDTLIEVLFAITVFSLVAVGALSIMNQGVSTAQRSLEISLAREQMDAQAEALRFMNRSYVANYTDDKSVADYTNNGTPTAASRWKEVSSDPAITQPASEFARLNEGECPKPTDLPGGKAFVVNTNSTTLALLQDPSQFLAVPATYAKLNTSATPVAEGLWVEAVRGEGEDPTIGFIDFHIRACWESPGQALPVTLGTIVRLYEPRG